MSQIQARGATVLAISADTVDSHRSFAEKYRLPFALLADPDKHAIQAYGALGKNGFANRWTFIVGPDGLIRHIDRAVSSTFSQQNGELVSTHGGDVALLLSDWKAKSGGHVPNFSLATPDGATVTPFRPGKKGAVVVFLSNECPVSRAYEARLKAIAAAHPDISFLGVVSNSDQGMPAVKALSERAQLGFPVAKDARSAIADHFDAQATPTVWLMDAKGNAIYHGAVDDNQDAGSVSKQYLADALAALEKGQPVPTAETRAFGCAIHRG